MTLSDCCPVLDCGGKRSATPLFGNASIIQRATACESAVAATLCRRSPKITAVHGLDTRPLLEVETTHEPNLTRPSAFAKATADRADKPAPIRPPALNCGALRKRKQASRTRPDESGENLCCFAVHGSKAGEARKEFSPGAVGLERRIDPHRCGRNYGQGSSDASSLPRSSPIGGSCSAGDEGVAATSKQRGVASTPKPTASFRLRNT
jgi:hypothetical protein